MNAIENIELKAKTLNSGIRRAACELSGDRQ